MNRNDPWGKFLEADQKTLEAVYNKLSKMGTKPSVQNFPFKHNYDALFGWDGISRPGGTRLDDPKTRIDSRGVAYLPETEEQRIYRYEKTRKRFERELEYRRFRYEGPLKKDFFMGKVKKNLFNWKKKPHPNAKRKRKPDGNFEWVVPNTAKTTRVKDWLRKAERGEVFQSWQKKIFRSSLIKPDKSDVDVVSRKSNK